MERKNFFVIVFIIFFLFLCTSNYVAASGVYSCDDTSSTANSDCTNSMGTAAYCQGGRCIQVSTSVIDFKRVNPLNLGVNQDITVNDPNAINPRAEVLSTPAGFLGQILVYGIPLAGLILFVMILWGGFEIVASSTNSSQKDAGKQRVTAALIGFFLLFASYWIVQLVQIVFGVNILG